jgi:hypothetical protein
MSARVVTQTEPPMPRRARYLIPRGVPRRGEFLAASAVLVVLAHVLFAQLTLVIAVVLWLTTKITRWRLSWLAAPAAAGLVWTLAEGPRAAAAGFADGPAQVVGYLGARGHQLTHLLHFNAAFAGMAGWLPRQLPLALLAGSVEAALAGWLTWLHTDEWNLPRARPGLLVAVRRAAARRAIRAGSIVTRDGGCLGVAETGGRVTVSWSEAAGGVCVCGSAEQDVLATSFQLVHAAVRRRKPVFALDLTADPGLPRRLAAVCAAAGVPLQTFGNVGHPQAAAAPAGLACYEPFRHGDPARRASLVAAMICWDGPGSQYRRSCLAYLEDVFELVEAAPGDPRVPVLDEIIHLLNPAAMRARMAHVPASYPRRDVLAERTRVSVSLLAAEPATTAELARQLRELRASPFGRWLRPSSRGPAAEIDTGRTVTGRAVALFCLGGTSQPESSAMLTRLICQDLLSAGAALHGIGVGGDGIVWLAECGSMPRTAVTGMIARGPETGLPVLATTTSAQAAADLAGLANVVVAHRVNDTAAAQQIAADVGLRFPPLSAGSRYPESAAGFLHQVEPGYPVDPGYPVGPAKRAGLWPGPAAAVGGVSALRDGEFLLAVKDPFRVVPRGLLVRARIPRAARAVRSAAAPRRARDRA